MRQALAVLVAIAAIDKEWPRLRSRRAWGECTARQWRDVAADARTKSQEVHMGMLVGFAVEKTRTFLQVARGRLARAGWFPMGNNVVNHNREAAMFQDLGNAPATM